MKRQLLGFMSAALVAVLAVGCKTDPTASLAGGVARITTSLSFVTMNLGDSVFLSAVVRDQAGDPVTVAATATSADASISDLSPVTTTPLAQTAFYVKGLAPGSTVLHFTAGAATDSVVVVVFPLQFGGAVAIAKTALLDTVTVSASSQITFDSTASEVTIDGVASHIVSRTADQIVVLALNKGAVTGATVNISNLTFLGQFPISDLDASATIDTRGDATEPANNDPATAPTLVLNGTNFTTVDGVFDGSADVDDFFAVTITAPTTITAEIDFDGLGSDPDLDMYILDATAADFCVLDGCDAATGAQPQVATTTTLAPGTYYIYVNFFDGGDGTAPYWYRLKVKKNS